jgi:hypothetical protein
VNTHHLHRIVVAGRDTCNGACETAAGCSCTGRFADTVPVQPAEACTELGAEPRGKHRDSALTRFALWLRRVLG